MVVLVLTTSPPPLAVTCQKPFSFSKLLTYEGKLVPVSILCLYSSRLVYLDLINDLTISSTALTRDMLVLSILGFMNLTSWLSR